jgi:hypothetical protein
MFKRSLFSLLAFAVVTAGLRANAVDSRITAVTVYRDRAVVTRTTDTRLVAGINKLIFNALPVILTQAVSHWIDHLIRPQT